MREDARIVLVDERYAPSFFARLSLAFTRLTFPVCSFTIVHVAAVLTFGMSVGEFADRLPFSGVGGNHKGLIGCSSLGVALAPLVFLFVNLTNRRYGTQWTLGAIAVSWALLGGLIAGAGAEWGMWQVERELGPLDRLGVLAAALVLGELAAVVFFSSWRGVPWWRAPLAATLSATLVFGVALLLLAPRTLSDFALTPGFLDVLALAAVWAALQLGLYAMIRGRIRPMGGLGGR